MFDNFSCQAIFLFFYQPLFPFPLNPLDVLTTTHIRTTRTTCDFAFGLTLLRLTTTSPKLPRPGGPLVFVLRTNPVAVQLKTDVAARLVLFIYIYTHTVKNFVCVHLSLSGGGEQTASTQLNALSWEK